MKDIVLHNQWLIKAPLRDVFNIVTDFENWPKYFPKVADSIRVIHHRENDLEIEARVKSFGRNFPVKMKTRILPGKGFTSDNESPKFGTSGHEELLLTENAEGTIVDYRYQVNIHKRWLRVVAKPLIGWLFLLTMPLFPFYYPFVARNARIKQLEQARKKAVPNFFSRKQLQASFKRKASLP